MEGSGQILLREACFDNSSDSSYTKSFGKKNDNVKNPILYTCAKQATRNDGALIITGLI